MGKPRDPVKVVVLTQEHCGFCEDAKLLFGRLATEYPLSVSIADLESEEGQALARRSGILFPPGIILNGVAFSYGRPSEKKLRRELERLLKSTADDAISSFVHSG
jgi:thiol-disulfide isomerase/thioredoxin